MLPDMTPMHGSEGLSRSEFGVVVVNPALAVRQHPFPFPLLDPVI
jgi:hypothetical protein